MRPRSSVTGQVRTELIGTDGFQEADISGITMPIVKHSVMIRTPGACPRATTRPSTSPAGRPGAVLVDVPQDLSRADIPYEPVSKLNLPGYRAHKEGNAKQIRLAAKARPTRSHP